MGASLYEKLGGYDSIAAVVDQLLPRLMSDPVLGRFWKHRGDDGILREKQLLISFLCAQSGGPVLYTGRDNKSTHRGMRIDEKDWQIFMTHLETVLTDMNVPDESKNEVITFISGTKSEIVE